MTSKFTRHYLPELFALNFRRSKPSVVTVNLTSRCNQRCIYCEIGKEIPSFSREELTKEDLFWIIDEMAINKIRRMALCGGEPFLFAGLMAVVAYAGKNNIRCAITTNGMTACKLSKEELILLKKHKTEINISIDSFRDSIQSVTRGTPAALTNALKSIKYFGDNNIQPTLLAAISKYNYHDLSEFFAQAWEKGIKQVLFQPIIYFSNFPDRPAIDEKSQLNVGIENIDTLLVELRKILYFERKHQIKTNVYRILPWIESYLKTAAGQGREWFFDEVLDAFYCREIDAIIDIAYDGGIQPCGLVLASINIHQNRQPGLLALWAEATREIKEDIENQRYREYCNGCCHHFSRNMLASIMKHPIKNRRAFYSIFPLIFARTFWGVMKKFKMT